MTVTYIFHSAFAIETTQSVLIFDYWLDPAHVIDSVLKTGKHVYVLASHFHEDHFDRSIFAWRQHCPSLSFTYILSKDILRHRRASREDADVWLAKGGEWSDGTVRVHAAGSTDSGVSWIVETEGTTIFHAGDLNNWYARFLNDDCRGEEIVSEEFGIVNPLKEEKLYFGELKDISKVCNSFDIVMFPVDGRIGNGYTRGGRQFIERFRVGLFIPMHFAASGYESAWRMREFTDKAGIAFWQITHEGEKFITGHGTLSAD